VPARLCDLVAAAGAVHRAKQTSAKGKASQATNPHTAITRNATRSCARTQADPLGRAHRLGLTAAVRGPLGHCCCSRIVDSREDGRILRKPSHGPLAAMLASPLPRRRSSTPGLALTSQPGVARPAARRANGRTHTWPRCQPTSRTVARDRCPLNDSESTTASDGANRLQISAFMRWAVTGSRVATTRIQSYESPAYRWIPASTIGLRMRCAAFWWPPRGPSAGGE
jgi:hypothetical protein